MDSPINESSKKEVNFMEEGVVEEAVPAKKHVNGRASDVGLSIVSRKYDIDGDGKLDEAEQAMRDMDKSGKGHLSNERVYALMSEHLKMQKELFKFKKVIIGLVVFVVLLTLCNLGTSFAAASLAKEASTNTMNQLVSSGSGKVLSTQTTANQYELEKSSEDLRGRLLGSDTQRVTSYTVTQNVGNNIIADCEAANTVVLKRIWYDNSHDLFQICPDTGGQAIHVEADGSGMTIPTSGITLTKYGNEFAFAGAALLQDDGQICDDSTDCDNNNCLRHICGGDAGVNSGVGDTSGTAEPTCFETGCPSGYYCYTPYDKFVESNNCENSDEVPVCEPVPTSCNGPSKPMCGCDGQPYQNDCLAAMNGLTSISYDGGCLYT